MRGIGLLLTTIILLTAFSLPLVRVANIYALRKEILEVNLEKNIELSEIEIIKRVIVSDLLCRIDLHLSKGKFYSIWTSPDEIIMPIARSWASSLMIHAIGFKLLKKVDVLDGIHGKIVFDGGGYPLSVKVNISLSGKKVKISKDEVVSLRHTARIEEARKLALYYLGFASKMIKKAMLENRTLSYEWSGRFGTLEASLKVYGGPEVYRYLVEVKDRGKGAILDLRLNYGFRAEGMIRNEASNQ